MGGWVGGARMRWRRRDAEAGIQKRSQQRSPTVGKPVGGPGVASTTRLVWLGVADRSGWGLTICYIAVEVCVWGGGGGQHPCPLQTHAWEGLTRAST